MDCIIRALEPVLVELSSCWAASEPAHDVPRGCVILEVQRAAC